MPNVDRLLMALGDPTRRSIFERLNGRAQAVGEMARDMPVSRPAVSQHLKVLRAAGLITDEQRGNRRIYSVAPEGIAKLQTYLETFQPRSLAASRAGEANAAARAAKPRVRLKPIVRQEAG